MDTAHLTSERDYHPESKNRLRELAYGRFPTLLNAIAEMLGRQREQAKLAGSPWTRLLNPF